MAGSSSNNPSNSNNSKNNPFNDEINSNHPLYLWKRSLMIALNAKNKMKIITGEFVEPRVDSELRALWERNNDMLISWILNTVSEQIGNNLNFINSASKLWLELQEHYAQIDGHRIYQLSNDIVQLKQENSFVEVYYQKLKELMVKETKGRAYTMVRQEEKQREGIAPKSTSSTILNNYSNRNNAPNNHNHPKYDVPNTPNSRFTPQSLAQASFERKSNFRNGVYCRNCGKEGHFQEECYKIVGYPIGHPLYEKVQPTKQFKATKAVNMNQINQVLMILQQNGPSHGIFSSKSTNLPKFTATLITCLQVAWIIDSGATNHICTALKLMHNIYKCKTPIIVNLPNGQTVKVTTIGSVTINKYVTFHNVFYIPTFTYNILSVSKLLHGTTISLILTASLCVFQDQNKRITLGSLCDGLYFLNSPPKVFATTPTILHSSSKSQLWHSRLGHPSLTVLKKIKCLSHLIPQTTHDTEQTTSPIQTDPTEKPNDTIYSSTPTPNPSPSHTTINPTPTPPIPDQPPQPTRTSTRTKQVPNKLSDYQCSIPKSLIHHIQKHSFHKYINYDNIKSKSTRNFIHTLNTSTEPHTYAQASKDLKWVEATNKELKALEANKTWELVLLPPNKLPIGCK
ncbi:cysteine-rich receptor-like protein kinase 8 [Tanacetum coccineum]